MDWLHLSSLQAASPSQAAGPLSAWELLLIPENRLQFSASLLVAEG